MRDKGHLYFRSQTKQKSPATAATVSDSNEKPQFQQLYPLSRATRDYKPRGSPQIIKPLSKISATTQPKTLIKAEKNEADMTQTELQKEATHEAEKDLQKQEAESKQQLSELTDAAQRVLFKTKTVFPFDLFPNDVIVNDDKVDIVFREFFMAETIHSEMIEELKDVVVETSPFFATLRLVDTFNVETCVKYLPTKDALKARDIIQGLVVAKKRGLDLTNMTKEEILKKIQAIGKVDAHLSH
jgi:hypothetical protein